MAGGPSNRAEAELSVNVTVLTAVVSDLAVIALLSLHFQLPIFRTVHPERKREINDPDARLLWIDENNNWPFASLPSLSLCLWALAVTMCVCVCVSEFVIVCVYVCACVRVCTRMCVM